MPIGIRIALFLISNMGTIYKTAKAVVRLIEESGEERKALEQELVAAFKDLVSNGSADKLNKLLSKLTQSCDSTQNPSGVPPTNES